MRYFMKNARFKAMMVTEEEKGLFSNAIVNKSIDDLPQGDILIRVHYSSINYKDVLSIQGNRGVTRSYPHTPGIDAAGIVEASTGAHIRADDPVIVTGYDLGMNTSGGFSEYIRVPETWVVPLPANLTLKESMMYGTAGFTAGLSCERLFRHGITPEDGKILVTGATGGVGSLAVSILSNLGYSVTAVNGHNDRTDYLISLGATEVLPLEEAIDTSPKPLLDQRWAAAVDAVGGPLLETAIKYVGRHGIVTTCGNVGGADLNTSVYPFILRGITLAGIDSATTPMGLRKKIWEGLAGEWKIPNLAHITTEIDGLEALEDCVRDILNHKRTGRSFVRVG
jgi:acrylyl-CoA reductase (NADPH)